MSNKNYPGNESFTITLTDLWYFSTLPASGPRNKRDSLKHCDLMQQQQ